MFITSVSPLPISTKAIFSSVVAPSRSFSLSDVANVLAPSLPLWVLNFLGFALFSFSRAAVVFGLRRVLNLELNSLRASSFETESGPSVLLLMYSSLYMSRISFLRALSSPSTPSPLASSSQSEYEPTRSSSSMFLARSEAPSINFLNSRSSIFSGDKVPLDSRLLSIIS